MGEKGRPRWRYWQARVAVNRLCLVVFVRLFSNQLARSGDNALDPRLQEKDGFFISTADDVLRIVLRRGPESQ